MNEFIYVVCGGAFFMALGFIVGCMWAWREMNERNLEIAENMAWINGEFAKFIQAQKSVLDEYTMDRKSNDQSETSPQESQAEDELDSPSSAQ